MQKNDKEKFHLLSKIFKMFKEYLFPFPQLISSNRKVVNKINKILNNDKSYQFEYVKNYKNLSIDQLNEFLKNTLEKKKILEDKAKSSLIAITVTFSLLLTLDKTLVEVRNLNKGIIYYVIYLLAIMGLAYLGAAGIISLYSIGEVNKEYQIYPEDLTSGKNILLDTIASDIELNSKYNTIRNNYMGVSYKCISSAIVCFFIFFLTYSLLPQSYVSYDNQIKNIKNEQKSLVIKLNNVEKKQRNHDINDVIDLINKQKVLIDTVKKSEVDSNQITKDNIRLKELEKLQIETIKKMKEINKN